MQVFALSLRLQIQCLEGFDLVCERDGTVFEPIFP